MITKIDKLETISPIDGRYRKVTELLSTFFSERALIGYRISIEGEYLIALTDKIDSRKLSGEERQIIRNFYNVTLEDAQLVKDIETNGYKDIKATNHDIKAVEYYLKERLKETSLKDSLEFIHFALTSEDVNNIAYSLMLRDSLEGVIITSLDDLYKRLYGLSLDYKSVPMLARTHGQPASPTTLGKELFVFASRLEKQLLELKERKICAKLNGATGNYNAHYVAYPNIDWVGFSKEFIESFNKNNKIQLVPNLITTQIEPHDSYIELFDNLKRINNILIGLDQDIWHYISDSWFKQKTIAGEVGSSTMPHKVNPTDFEKSEGNLGLANALFEFFSRKLSTSRLQRDLSDSTVLRNIGSAFAYSLIAYKSTLKGLNKIDINKEKMISDLEAHPEIIAEAIQTILRRENLDKPYEQLKDLTRGKKVTLGDITRFISCLDINSKVKEELMRIKPTNYTGIAELLVR